MVTGERKEELGKMMETAFRNGEKPQMDYRYYPLKWGEPIKTRRFQCGLQLYKTLGDKAPGKRAAARDLHLQTTGKKIIQVALYFLWIRGLANHSWITGRFQSVMLAAMAEGLAACPQAALGEYPKIVKETP